MFCIVLNTDNLAHSLRLFFGTIAVIEKPQGSGVLLGLEGLLAEIYNFISPTTAVHSFYKHNIR